jgi:uncharacterized membrane protein
MPSYATDVAPLVQLRCAPCHFPGPAGIEFSVHPLDTYAHLKPQAIDVITQIRCPAKMPPAGAPPLTDDETTTLLEWLYCAAPDN